MKKLIILFLLMNTSIMICDVFMRENYIVVSITKKTFPLLDYYTRKLINQLENKQDAEILLYCKGLDYKRTEKLFKKFLIFKNQIVLIEFNNMEFDSLPTILNELTAISNLHLTDCQIQSINTIKFNIDTLNVRMKFIENFNIPKGILNIAKNIDMTLEFEHFDKTYEIIPNKDFEEFTITNNLISFCMFAPPMMPFPDFIFGHKKLNKLILSGCKFDYIPDKFDNLTKLGELLFLGITLKSNCFPISLKKLMKKLDIHYPKFETCDE